MTPFDHDVRETGSSSQHNRHSIRLQGYDYSQTGSYFVTICTQNRECRFGNIVDGTMQLNQAGQVVADEWIKTAEIRGNIALDEWMVMPNHFHGILVIADCLGMSCRAQMAERFGCPITGSIPTIVRSFKSGVTKRINEMRQSPGEKLWQRNYWEHIIRNEMELERIRKYIHNNPAQWEWDQLHPNMGPMRHVGSEIRELHAMYGAGGPRPYIWLAQSWLEQND